MTDPKVSIIIPTLHLERPRNKNPKHFLYGKYTLRDVLGDLDANVRFPIEVIVICNGQDQGLKDLIVNHRRVDKYAMNSTNVGVSRAWNMGAMLAEGDVLCFLNDDVAVGPGAVETLYQALMADPSIGEVGPKGARWLGANHQSYVGETKMEDADAISGFLFMLRTPLFFQVGGFDVGYTPAGFEEIDMSFAVRQHGYRCVVVPGLDVKHYGRHGASASAAAIQYLGRSIDPGDLNVRNRSYFMRKWKLANDSQNT